MVSPASRSISMEATQGKLCQYLATASTARWSAGTPLRLKATK